MSADILRRAATVLRERAEAVTAHNGGKDLWFEADIDLRIAIRTQFPGNAKSAREDAKWIELMTPTVGLALADWLDTMHVIWGGGGKHVFGLPPSDDDQPLAKAGDPIDPTSRMGCAITVARAILGGDA